MAYNGPMNIQSPIRNRSVGHTACPHDCPSTCALDVELTEDGRIGRMRGATENSYTAGVICAKVARYAERLFAHRATTPDDHFASGAAAGESA